MNPDVQPESASNPPGAFDRKQAREWLKEQIAHEPPILGQIARLRKDAQLEAFKARDAKKKRSRQDRLRNTQVTSLLRKDASVNPVYLVGAGIFTADHILELGASKLRERAGIDANAAAKWVNAARDVKRAQDGDDIPPPQPSRWVEEDVDLVRSLLILDSIVRLQHDPHTVGLSYTTDLARALLKSTSALRWKLSAGRQADVFEDIAELTRWIASGNGRAHLPLVEDHLARHFARVDALRDPNDVARAWGRQSEELLILMRESAL